MLEDSVLRTVRAAVHEASPEAKDVDDDTPLIAGRIIDSLSLLSLVSQLEAELGISVRDAEMLPGNFESIRAIRAFLGTKGC